MLTTKSNTQKFYKYLQERTGVSNTNIKRILRAIAEYVALTLIEKTVLRIPYLGDISVRKGDRNRVRFIPIASLRAALQEWDSKLLSEKYSSSSLLKENSTKKEQRAYTYLERLQGFKQQAIKDRTEIIRKSLLCYLQNDFVWGKDWKHPFTKDIYPVLLIQEKLIALKDLDSESYKVLYILWLTLKERKRKAGFLRVSEKDLYKTWYRAIDRLLILILLPELDPNTIEILRPKKDGNGSKSFRKSQQCNGLYRATRGSNEISRGNDKKRDSLGESWGVGSDFWANQKLI